MLPHFPFGNQFNDRIGTSLLKEADPLLVVDSHYLNEVGLKRQLLTELPNYYFQSLPSSETGQWDVLGLVLDQLARHYPDQFLLKKAGLHWHWENRLLDETTSFTFDNTDTLPLPPLDWVGRQVQEDLLLLVGPGPSLVAGQLCFANAWCLDEKMGLPFWAIHAPITNIVEPMMRAAQKVMERLPAGRPIWRLNWSIKATDQLDLTSRHTPTQHAQLAALLPHLTADTVGQHLYVRIEYQTLTRLPRSQAILFGLHTYQNRLDRELTERPDAAQNLLNVLQTTPPALLDYKGITPFLPLLLAGLAAHIAYTQTRVSA
ncbi:heme-dependent oxidative N-demethylase family protein [Fibrella aquatilis]|uniref:DUF3445 domain-containing protein n=1 Tax=Fibrella aquatilis TaxID=2817059 RepID=A0A939GA35_9BACT|nr:DUF3445 domain-containing protein [Fibrella aquatilis]MBO0933090.1 DUF3445 domain-containing protein [Fibrella aquatilis]